MPSPTTLRSFSKINLGLRIGPPRPDGFHDLRTLYQTVALHDLVQVTAEPASHSQITLTSNDPRVPTDHRNTAWRILEAALTGLRITARIHVHIQKNLPLQGGLGAGSANAASALLGMEHQLNRSLPPPQRLLLAAQIGSDVPLFLLGGTVYGHSRGEAVIPYPDLPRAPCLIVLPLFGSATPAAFRAWDEQSAALTPFAAHDRLNELSRVYASAFTPAGNTVPIWPGQKAAAAGNQTGASGVSGSVGHLPSNAATDLAGNSLLALVRTGLENDFESVVFPHHPSLRDLKHALAGPQGSAPAAESISREALSQNGPPVRPALLSLLSGSGSSLFGLYRSEADAIAAQQRVEALGTGARVYLTHTLPRDEYWSSMIEA